VSRSLLFNRLFSTARFFMDKIPSSDCEGFLNYRAGASFYGFPNFYYRYFVAVSRYAWFDAVHRGYTYRFKLYYLYSHFTLLCTYSQKWLYGIYENMYRFSYNMPLEKKSETGIGPASLGIRTNNQLSERRILCLYFTPNSAEELLHNHKQRLQWKFVNQKNKFY